MNVRIIGIGLFMLLFSSVNADWPVGKGRTILLTGYSFLNSTSSYNNSWKKSSFGENNSFFTQIGNVSVLHGVGRNTDFILNVPFIYQRSTNQFGTKYGSGVGDMSFGIAKHFSSIDNHKYFTLKGLFTIPMYKLDTANNALGLGLGSRAFSLEANYSLPVGSAAYFVGQANYTNYFDNTDGPQQYTYTLTYGKRINFFNLVSISFSHQESYSPNKQFNPSIITNTSFINGRLALSYGKRITRTTLVLLQGSTIVYGKNTVGGLGGGISFITRLP